MFVKCIYYGIEVIMVKPSNHIHSLPTLIELISPSACLSPVLCSFQVKFFYICQMAYWLHALPELYFQKVRKVSAHDRTMGYVLKMTHLLF